ncbi:MAG: glycosyltransferase family 2 protein [Acidobacteriota bacterium]
MPEECPLVSIVTASYNSSAYIEKAIRSVAAQDYPNIEHLIIDGGSTDRTVEILERFDDRITWVSEPDKGQSDALNKGWARAGGKILGWLDADNVYEPGAVREAVEKLSGDTGMVYGGVRDIDERGEVVREYMPPEFTLRGFLLFHEFNFIPPSSVFVKREALDRSGLLDQALHYTMDFDLWLRLSLVTKIVREPRFWSRFLLRETSKTGSQMDRFGWDILRVSEKFFSRDDLPREVRDAEREIRARLLEHAADRVVTSDFAEGRRLYLRALKTAPFAARAALWRKVAYLYYRDSFVGRTYRGMKTGLKPVI